MDGGDPLVMDGGEHQQVSPQKGGFVDPGLAALIAVLISGGIGGYGYSRTTQQDLNEALDDEAKKYKANLQASVLELDKQKKNLAVAEAKFKEGAGQQIENLKKEIERLKKVIELTKKEQGYAVERSSESRRYITATADALKEAIAPFLAKLKVEYPNLFRAYDMSPEQSITDVLMYPVKPIGRLSRPSLFDLYTLRLEPVLKSLAERALVASAAKGVAAAAAAKAAVSKAIIATNMGNQAEAPALEAMPGDDMAGGARKRRYRRRVYRGGLSPGEKGPYPSFTEFVQMYTPGIPTIRAETEKKVDEAKAKIDNRVAAKAASTLADKLTAAVAAAKAEIVKSEGIRFTLSNERKKEIDKVLNELMGFIAEAEGSAYLSKEVEAKAKGWFRGGALSDITAENASATTLWNQVKTRGPKLLADIQDTTKKFVDEVKSQKKKESESFKSPPIRFGLPTIKVAMGNPFKALIKTLATAKTQTEQIDAIRTQSKEAVDFIKKNVKNANTMIKEINSLAGVKATKTKKPAVVPAQSEKQEEKEGSETPRSAANSEGSGDSEGTNPKETEVVEKDECTTIQADERYKNRTLLWFANNMQAIISGGEEDVMGDKRVYDPGTNMDADFIALEASLSKLNTGVLSSTLDWFKSVRGKELTYGFDMFIRAGNAYARLRCYVDEAKDLLNDPDRMTYIQRAKEALARKSAAPPPADQPFSAPNSQPGSPFSNAAAPGEGNARVPTAIVKPPPAAADDDSTPLELEVRADRKAAEEARRAALTPEQRAAEDAAAARERRMGEWSVEYGRGMEEQRKREEEAAALPGAAAASSSSNEALPTVAVPRIEDQIVTDTRQGVNELVDKYKKGALPKDETMKQIEALKEKLVGKNVASQVVLREQITALQKTLKGGRRRGSRKSRSSRKSRKRTLKKRRGGK